MLFSFIIPHRETESIAITKKQIEKACQYAGLQDDFEIISVSGTQPSVQRNAAVKVAKGEYLYFLDNDSLVGEKNLIYALELFSKNKKIGLIGGPSLTPDTDSFLQKNFGLILESNFAVGGKIKSRYAAIGDVRETDEYELILCNMIIKKTVFNQVGGFKEHLYPNEENVLVNDILKLNYKVYYHPKIIVYRSQRENLQKFIKQMLVYGRGRAEETLTMPRTFNVMIFIPLGFVIYIFACFVAIFFLNWKIVFSPLALYLLISVPFALQISQKKHNLFSFFLAFKLFFIVHFFYGLGLIYGYLKKLLGTKKIKQEVYYKID